MKHGSTGARRSPYPLWFFLPAAVIYGVGFAVVNLVIGLVAVNVAHRDGGLLLFDPRRLFVTIVLTVLASLLMAGIGVFISLRASTVKQAQQAFGIAIIVVTMGPLLLFNALGAERREAVVDRLSTIGETRLEIYIVSLLGLFCAFVIGAALARFKRGKLVLD